MCVAEKAARKARGERWSSRPTDARDTVYIIIYRNAGHCVRLPQELAASLEEARAAATSASERASELEASEKALQREINNAKVRIAVGDNRVGELEEEVARVRQELASLEEAAGKKEEELEARIAEASARVAEFEEAEEARAERERALEERAREAEEEVSNDATYRGSRDDRSLSAFKGPLVPKSRILLVLDLIGSAMVALRG